MWKERAALEKPSNRLTGKRTRSIMMMLGHLFCRETGAVRHFFPEDAHAGCIGEGKILKLVIKVRTA